MRSALTILMLFAAQAASAQEFGGQWSPAGQREVFPTSAQTPPPPEDTQRAMQGANVRGFQFAQTDARSAAPPPNVRPDTAAPPRQLQPPPTQTTAAQPLAPPTQATPITAASMPLAPPSQGREDGPKIPQSRTAALTTVVTSLAVVLGLFFVVVWITKRARPKSAAPLPGEVVEVMGRAQLTARQHLQVIRFGNKLLLVAVTQGGAETLTEVTDAAEVDRLAALCRQNQPNSVTASFRQVLQQFASEPAPGGFLGTAASAAPADSIAARDRQRRPQRPAAPGRGVHLEG